MFIASRVGHATCTAEAEPGLSASYSRDYPNLTSTSVVQEDFLTQLAPGDQVCHARTLTGDEGALLGLWERPLSVGGTLLKPDFVGVLLPVSWDGDFRMNGHFMAKNEVFAFGGDNGFISRGENRFMYALAMDRENLVKSLAALQGMYPESVSIPVGPLSLPAALKIDLCRRFHSLLHAGKHLLGFEPHGEPTVMESLYHCLLEIQLSAANGSVRRNASWRQSTRIVRRVMEEFARRGGTASLADLCAAGNVSSSTLYGAFNQVVGMPPLKYFQVQGINVAHRKFVSAANRRGAVAEIANDCGFSELGRFAGEYKKVFGVAPSVTLAGKHQAQ